MAGDGIGRRGGRRGQGAATLLTVLVSKHTFSLSSSIYLPLSTFSYRVTERERCPQGYCRRRQGSRSHCVPGASVDGGAAAHQ